MTNLRLIILLAVSTLGACSLAQEYSIRAVRGLPGAQETYINAPNSLGQITGISRFYDGPSKAFIIDGDELIDIGSLGESAIGVKVNDHGKVVGTSRDEDN